MDRFADSIRIAKIVGDQPEFPSGWFEMDRLLLQRGHYWFRGRTRAGKTATITRMIAAIMQPYDIYETK